MLSDADGATGNEAGVSASPETGAGVDKAEGVMFKCLDQANGEVASGRSYSEVLPKREAVSRRSPPSRAGERSGPATSREYI